MKKIIWNSLSTVHDWVGVLELLLTEARQAVTAGDAERRANVQRLLITFAEESPPLCNPLDDIASTAAADLYSVQTDAALRALAVRATELGTAAERLEGITQQAQQSARDIQLDALAALLRKAQEAITTLKTLETNLQKPDADLVAALQELEKAIAALGRV